MGVVLWHDAPIINEVVGFALQLAFVILCLQVIIDLQWFADALASVIGIMTKHQAAREGGFLDIMPHIRNR